MKRLVAWLMGGLVLFSLVFALMLPSAAYAADRRNIADDKIAERAGKIDLNNCSVRRFQAYPGMYPTLAVDAVFLLLALSAPGLSGLI